MKQKLQTLWQAFDIGTFIIAWIGIVILLFIYNPYDDTDPENGRSGLSVYIDNKSGCQYLGTLFGGLTPRLNREGKQYCE